MSFYDQVKNASYPYASLRSAITEVANQHHIPIGAMFELSPVCNFKCPFCYARKTPEEMRERGERVLRFPFWKRMTDEACELGSVEFTLTGGECMLHPDFVEIYRYAYSKGGQLALMTNGSCVTPEILAMLQDCPPNGIFITLYGGSPETYERVCGSAKYYDVVVSNVKTLKKLGLPVTIQFTANKDNVADLQKVSKFAEEMDLKFRFARADFAFRRITPEMLASCEVSWEEFTSLATDLTTEKLKDSEEERRFRENAMVKFETYPVVEKGMTCGAGNRSFFIDHLGYMHPCLSLDDIRIDTKELSLADCWNEIVRISSEIPQLVECTNCLYRSHCKKCVALHYDDLGVFGKPSPRLCFKCQFPQLAAEIKERFDRDGVLHLTDM